MNFYDKNKRFESLPLNHPLAKLSQMPVEELRLLSDKEIDERIRVVMLHIADLEREAERLIKEANTLKDSFPRLLSVAMERDRINNETTHLIIGKGLWELDLDVEEHLIRKVVPMQDYVPALINSAPSEAFENV